MVTNENGIVSASRDELLAIWLFDDDLFKLFFFTEFKMLSEAVGVRVTN